MTSQQAQSVAQELGDILPNDEKLQAEINRLNRKSFILLEQVKMLHDWLDGKRQSRQSGRVLGESRTGKTMGCDAYRRRHKPNPRVVKIKMSKFKRKNSSHKSEIRDIEKDLKILPPQAV
jgi:DNA transposition AAA+ family ATPase